MSSYIHIYYIYNVSIVSMFALKFTCIFHKSNMTSQPPKYINIKLRLQGEPNVTELTLAAFQISANFGRTVQC